LWCPVNEQLQRGERLQMRPELQLRRLRMPQVN